MTVNVHITRINDTYANLSANLDTYQVAIRTDNNALSYKSFIWHDGTNLLEAAAIDKNARFSDVTINSLVAGMIKTDSNGKIVQAVPDVDYATTLGASTNLVGLSPTAILYGAADGTVTQSQNLLLDNSGNRLNIKGEIKVKYRYNENFYMNCRLADDDPGFQPKQVFLKTAVTGTTFPNVNTIIQTDKFTIQTDSFNQTERLSIETNGQANFYAGLGLKSYADNGGNPYQGTSDPANPTVINIEGKNIIRMVNTSGSNTTTAYFSFQNSRGSQLVMAMNETSGTSYLKIAKYTTVTAGTADSGYLQLTSHFGTFLFLNDQITPNEWFYVF